MQALVISPQTAFPEVRSGLGGGCDWHRIPSAVFPLCSPVTTKQQGWDTSVYAMVSMPH